MSTIREQIYQVAALDDGAGGVLDLLADGLNGLKGGEGSSPPTPGGQNSPWAYLGMVATVPKWTGASRLQPAGAMSGGHQWWLYDDERAGYVRLRGLYIRLLQLYGPYQSDGAWNVVKWADDDTGERVHGLEVPFLSNETADQDSGQLLLIGTWPWMLTYGVQSVV